ncbi:MAG: hypothetical protein ACOY3P_26830 [Planctomycetota bacterium]
MAGTRSDLEAWLLQRVSRFVLWADTYRSVGLYDAEGPILSVLQGRAPDLAAAVVMESIADQRIQSLVEHLCNGASESWHKRAGLFKLIDAGLSPEMALAVNEYIADDPGSLVMK